MSRGFADKLYWRLGPDGQHHCFKKTDVVDAQGKTLRRVFMSLCDKQYEREKSGGSEARRPHPTLRCGQCDGREMQRRGVDESMPATIPDEE